MYMSSSGVNNTELFDAESRLLVIDTEPRLSFSEKKLSFSPSQDSSQTNPSRAETLTKRVRAH